MDKVLFLDVDGVLNRNGTKETVTLPLGTFTGIDQTLLSRLKAWLSLHPDLLIVLSSTWRMSEDAKDHLRNHGLSWHDETPTRRESRSQEIKDWLALHPNITHYAILDDLPVKGHLVQTSMKSGLQPKHLKQLDKYLGYQDDKAV